VPRGRRAADTLFKCRFLELLSRVDPRLGQLYYLVRACRPPAARPPGRSTGPGAGPCAAPARIAERPPPRLPHPPRSAECPAACPAAAWHLRRLLPPPPRPQVKAWALAHDLNDASRGTFNSWSLTLMVGARAARLAPACPDLPCTLLPAAAWPLAPQHVATPPL
jgi:hypothetical protein